MEFTIEDVPWSAPDAVALRAAQRAEIAELYGTPDSEPGIAPSAADVPVFVVAYDPAGTPVACGGLRPVDAATGEVKRMYVAPPARGTGAAAAVLAALEDRARGRSWTRLSLETGHRQEAAIRFYARSGYTPAPPFAPYTDAPDSLFFTRALPAAREVRSAGGI
ncbi:GNAT family N-acetyltransferase [Streptomyces sp. NPDC020875]|uniref:GNAT family N-acetyltransferase n=1 Tax=Streptomyces sp. NPDC020875 TaxID=3154898 RepID=UPI0033BFD2E1